MFGSIEHQRQHRLLLHVVVVQRVAVLQLVAEDPEDDALLVARDALLVPDVALHIVDRVVGHHVERDRLAVRHLHEDLHAAVLALAIALITFSIIVRIITMVIIIAMVISMVISTALRVLDQSLIYKI